METHRLIQDEDEEFGIPEASSSHKELSIRVDGKRGRNDHRSKHSETEQRRRSKINDRFQILRGLIPNSDQKRDKASFLLEVIEYVHFLQEKVQKNEMQYAEWNQDPSKLMPWHNDQAPANISAQAEVFPGNGFPGGSALMSSAHNTEKADASAGVHYKTTETVIGYPKAENMTSQDQSQWSRPSQPTECAESSEMLNELDDLIIDERTINVSTAYSQGLMKTLTQTMQNSGFDLSQASISVQINLGRRANSRRNVAAATTSNSLDLEGPASPNQADERINGEEPSHPAKRLKF